MLVHSASRRNFAGSKVFVIWPVGGLVASSRSVPPLCRVTSTKSFHAYAFEANRPDLEGEDEEKGIITNDQ